jgi:hypothetical protein
MFGLRLTTQRELAGLYAVTDDLRNERDKLQMLVEKERNRADSAVNLLLAKTNGAILTPTNPILEKDKMEYFNKALDEINLFDDDTEKQTVMERIQADA